MGLKYGMSHVWATAMLIIWPELLPPGHQPHRMLLLKDYPSFSETKESISKVEPKLMIIDERAQHPAYDWMNLIRAYLDNQPLSDDNAEVECIMWKSRMYHLIYGVLYR
jgi:hypothetical protein